MFSYGYTIHQTSSINLYLLSLYTMKLHILSDLHIDSYQRRDLPLGSIPETDADVIILAGDISNSRLGMEWTVAQASNLNKPILYVAGNHEYFDEDVFQFDTELTALADGTSVEFLQMRSVDIDGVRFLGCTLWTDFCFGMEARHLRYMLPEALEKLPDPEHWSQEKAMDFARMSMRDYTAIGANDGDNIKLTPEAVLAIHLTHRDWLKNALQQAHDEGIPTVVISHHSVCPQSIAPKYQSYHSNGAFVTDFSDWMHADWAPTLWVHGHTHDAFDYVEGNTRVVVNPRAYPKEVSTTGVAFDWARVVEV